MKKDQSMKEIEQLLEMAPDITDTRTKDEVFARLKKEGAFEGNEKTLPAQATQSERPIIKEYKGNRLATLTVAALGLIAFGGMGGFLLSQNNSGDEASSGANEAIMMDGEMESAERSTNPFAVEEKASDMSMDATSNISESSLAFLGDLAGMQQLHLGLVTEQLEVVPVTVLINGGTSTSNMTTYLELYHQYAAQIDEEALGFMAYHPMEGTFKESNGELTHVLTADHRYDMGSASEYLYGQVLNQTFSPAFLHVNVVNEDGSPVEFAHMGLIDQIGLPPLTKQLYFVTELAGKRYMIPSYEVKADDAEQALQQLSEPPAVFNFESPIVSGVTYSTTVNSDVVIVTFTEPLDLADNDLSEVSVMLDAMIMTAASYGMRIQFDNVLAEEGFTYPIGEPIEKPIGANKIILNSK